MGSAGSAPRGCVWDTLTAVPIRDRSPGRLTVKVLLHPAPSWGLPTCLMVVLPDGSPTAPLNHVYKGKGSLQVEKRGAMCHGPDTMASPTWNTMSTAESLWTGSARSSIWSLSGHQAPESADITRTTVAIDRGDAAFTPSAAVPGQDVPAGSGDAGSCGCWDLWIWLCGGRSYHSRSSCFTPMPGPWCEPLGYPDRGRGRPSVLSSVTRPTGA